MGVFNEINDESPKIIRIYYAGKGCQLRAKKEEDVDKILLLKIKNG